MRPELYERVALRRDVNEHLLKKGDVALLIDRVPHPWDSNRGWCHRGFQRSGGVDLRGRRQGVGNRGTAGR